MTIKYGGRKRTPKEMASFIIEDWIQSGFQRDGLLGSFEAKDVNERVTDKELWEVEKQIEKIRLRIIAPYTN